MLNTLANHNNDIRELLEKGYAISLDSNYLIIRDVPYLDEQKNLKIGAIVSKLVFVDKEHVTLEDHQIFFCGSHPCELNGSPIKNMGGGAINLHLQSKDLVVERSFSNKPPGGFANLFDKIESYVNIISGPAITLYNANPWTFRAVKEELDSVFKLVDTLTSQSETGDISISFKEDVIAIIGLGGTGSYILDFIAKTPVKEIRGFDLDWFYVHNSFRSPGRLMMEELGKRKADVYQKRYEEFRYGINLQAKLIQADSEEDLQGVSFAFVCVDKGDARAEIFKLLVKMKIPFIDTGMGLERAEGKISGTIRTNYYPVESAQEFIEKKWAPLSDLPDEIYRNNVQLSELNAMNACIAVARYKQLRGFYADDSSFHHMLFTLDNLHATGEQ